VADPYDTKYIAENVYYLRKHIVRLTQEEFSEMVNLSKDTISNIERGRYRPNLENLVEISNVTHVSIEYFLREREEDVVQ